MHEDRPGESEKREHNIVFKNIFSLVISFFNPQVQLRVGESVGRNCVFS